MEWKVFLCACFYVPGTNPRHLYLLRTVMQERPEDVPSGELPRSLQVICDRSLVGTASPGTRVTLVGVYAIHAAQSAKENKGAVAIRNPYIKCAPSHSRSPASRCHWVFFHDLL